MNLQTYTTLTGFVLPSIHSFPPFFTLQPNLQTQTTQTSHWIRLILSYARYRTLFILRLEDAEVTGGEWDEIFRNERIESQCNVPSSYLEFTYYFYWVSLGRLQPAHLSMLLSSLVAQNSAIWDPPNQKRSVLLYWKSPEDWAETLHGWAAATGQLNSIMTFFEITEPAIVSPLSSVPITLLKKAIAILAKSGRAQSIEIADGEGVRFFQRHAID